MDFVGNEDAVRYAMEAAFREHIRQRGDLPLDVLPSAGVARAFLKELEERGWVLRKPSVCATCGKKHIVEEVG